MSLEVAPAIGFRSSLHLEQHLQLILYVVLLKFGLAERQNARVWRLHPVLGRRGQC
jgi:hypothetical protein